MIPKTKSKLILIGSQAVLAATFLSGGTAHAACSDTGAGGIQAGANCAGSGLNSGSLTGNIQTIVNVFLYALGIGAVIMLIVGGFQFIFSSGNSEKAGKARLTILYAVIGIIVALLALTIVNFVIGKFGKG